MMTITFEGSAYIGAVLAIIVMLVAALATILFWVTLSKAESAWKLACQEQKRAGPNWLGRLWFAFVMVSFYTAILSPIRSEEWLNILEIAACAVAFVLCGFRLLIHNSRAREEGLTPLE